MWSYELNTQDKKKRTQKRKMKNKKRGYRKEQTLEMVSVNWKLLLPLMSLKCVSELMAEKGAFFSLVFSVGRLNK